MSGILGGIDQAVGDLGSGLGDALRSNNATSSASDNINQAAGIIPSVSISITGVATDTASSTLAASLTLTPPSASASASSQSSSLSVSASSVPLSSSSVSGSSSSSSSSSITASSVTTSPTSASSPTSAADEQTSTSLSIAIVSASGTASGAAATNSPAPAPVGFLQNKPLAGAVFGLAGLVGLVLLFVIATWALRRRKRSRLLDEAISFEPTAQHTYAEDMERLNEKRASNGSYSRNYGTAGYYNGGVQPGYNQQYTQFTPPSQLVRGGYTA